MRIKTTSLPSTTTVHDIAADRLLRTGLTLLFVILMIAASSFKLYIPGFVPTTLQTLVATLAVITVGTWHGTAVLSIYILLGMCSIPVFANSSGGLNVILGHTGGYILGFLIIQPILGYLLNRSANSPIKIVGSITLAYTLVFVIGIPWLKIVTGMSWTESLSVGLLPFLITESIKIAITLGLASLILPWRLNRGWH